MKIGIVGDSILLPCYSDDTEVLTGTGWKLFSELTYDDTIATLNPNNNQLEYHRPELIYSKDYTGPMYEVDSKFISLKVTPNHKMYVATPTCHREKGKIVWSGFGKYRLLEAHEILGKTARYKQNALWSGIRQEYYELPEIVQEIPMIRNNGMEHLTIVRRKPSRLIPMNIWMEFVGYFIGDGYITREKRFPRKETHADTAGYVVGIALGSDKKNTEIKRRILEILPQITDASPNWSSSHRQLIFRDRQVYEALTDIKRSKDHARCIPRKYLQLASEHLQYLWKGLLATDGHVNKNGGCDVVTSSKQLRDDIQELLLKIGSAGSYSKHMSMNHVSYINGREIMPKAQSWRVGRLGNGHRNFLEPAIYPRDHRDKYVPYSGMVYSVSVPNHIVYVRRNGKCVWSGNTSYGKTGFKLLSALKKRGHDVVNFALQHAGAPVDYEGVTIYQSQDEATFAKALIATKPDFAIHLRDAWTFTRYYQKQYHLWSACRENKVCFISNTPVQSWPLPQDYIDTVWNEADYTITMTKIGMQKLIEQGAPAERLAYLYHGAEERFFHFMEERPPRSMFNLPDYGHHLITFVGLNQDHRKMIPLAVLAYKLYMEKYDPDAVLYLHTDWGGFFDVAQHVRALGLGGSHKVFLRPASGMGSSMWGFTDEQMGQLYSMSDVLLTMSTAEGFFIPGIESLACGTPVVYTDTPVMREVLGWSDIAYPVPSKKIFPNAYTLEWLADPDAAADLIHKAVQQGRKKVQLPPHFIWDNIAIRLEEILKSWL